VCSAATLSGRGQHTFVDEPQLQAQMTTDAFKDIEKLSVEIAV
jgi:hypothetical protein